MLAALRVCMISSYKACSCHNPGFASSDMRRSFSRFASTAKNVIFAYTSAKLDQLLKHEWFATHCSRISNTQHVLPLCVHAYTLIKSNLYGRAYKKIRCLCTYSTQNRSHIYIYIAMFAFKLCCASLGTKGYSKPCSLLRSLAVRLNISSCDVEKPKPRYQSMTACT